MKFQYGKFYVYEQNNEYTAFECKYGHELENSTSVAIGTISHLSNVSKPYTIHDFDVCVGVHAFNNNTINEVSRADYYRFVLGKMKEHNDSRINDFKNVPDVIHFSNNINYKFGMEILEYQSLFENESDLPEFMFESLKE